MRLDFHTHIGPYPDDRSLDELLQMLDANGMDAAVALPSRGLRGSPSVYARANEYVAEAMQRYPRRVVGFCTLNPWHGQEALAEFERAVRQLGLRGLKLHPPTQGFDVADEALMDPLMTLAAELDVPVVIHGGLRVHDNPLRFGLLAQAHPRVRLVMLHSNFGGTDRVGVRWAAASAANLYFETSATNEPAFIAELAGWVGSDRIFFGSDWPWLPPRLERAMVECSGLPHAQIDAILGDSAARFLGIAA
jgi:predicted TIM-barrel fold metal-dependent hydrolase